MPLIHPPEAWQPRRFLRRLSGRPLAEAEGAFSDGRMYLERLIQGGRHIEFQVLCDGTTAKVIGERECSVQRRHQKLIEESPSPAMSRDEVAEMALAGIPNGDFWLLEHTEESKAKVQRRAEMIINKTTPVPESVG